MSVVSFPTRPPRRTRPLALPEFCRWIVVRRVRVRQLRRVALVVGSLLLAVGLVAIAAGLALPDADPGPRIRLIVPGIALGYLGFAVVLQWAAVPSPLRHPRLRPMPRGDR